MAATRQRKDANTHRLGTLWVRPEVADRLRAAALREGRSVSDVMRQALNDYLRKTRA